MSITGRNTYLNALHKDLVKAAETYYNEQYKAHFDYTGSFDLDKTKDSYGRLFKDHLEDVIQIKNAINHRTLINVIKSGFAINAQKNTLNIFSQFLGYSDFEDYCSKTNNAQNKAHEESKPQPSYWKRNKTTLVSALAVCFFGFLAFKAYNIWLLSEQKDLIHHTIAEANKAQFDSFKELPNINSKILEKYYLKNGKAIELLKKIINKHAVSNYTIGQPKDNPSYHNIQQINIQQLTRTEAIVETKEHWFLKWYNTKTKKYERKYDVSNTQFYKLVKIKNNWEIESNDYTGESKKIDE